MLVEGEAGVGKSRLAEDFLRWVVANSGTVLRGRGYDARAGVPYGPLVEVLRAAMGASGPRWDRSGVADRGCPAGPGATATLPRSGRAPAAGRLGRKLAAVRGHRPAPDLGGHRAPGGDFDRRPPVVRRRQLQSASLSYPPAGARAHSLARHPDAWANWSAMRRPPGCAGYFAQSHTLSLCRWVRWARSRSGS